MIQDLASCTAIGEPEEQVHCDGYWSLEARSEMYRSLNQSMEGHVKTLSVVVAVVHSRFFAVEHKDHIRQ